MYAAEEKKSACKFIAISLRAIFFFSMFQCFIGMEHFPLLDKSSREASDSKGGMLSVGKY